MKNRAWFLPRLLAGFTITSACLLATQGLFVLGGDDARHPSPKKTAPGQAQGKDVKKTPAKDDDPKPGRYEEDPLTSEAEKNYKGSGAYKWLNVALQATAREHERHGARPTIGSRNLAIVVTAMYDAWAAYDAKAVGTRLGGELRRPLCECTTANKDKAIGYAVCRVLLDIYPEDATWI